MKNITRSSILLGLGLLAAGNFITAPVSAAPNDRPFLKDQKKNDHRGDHNDDKGRPGRPGNNNGRPGDWNNGRPGRPGNNNNRPGGWNNGRPGNNNSNRDVSFTGRVLSDTRGNDFDLRVGSRTIRVYAVKGEPRGLSRGDTVKVNGRYDGGTFRATGVAILSQGRR